MPKRASGYHPSDPDYTEGRGLYVAAAERDARSRLGYVRVKLREPQHRPT